MLAVYVSLCKRKYDNEFHDRYFKIAMHKCFNCICRLCSGLQCPKLHRYEYGDYTIPYTARKLTMCLNCIQYEKKPIYECSYFLNKQIKRYRIKRKRLSSAMTYEQIKQLRDLLNTFIDGKQE
jgi:hypothetical protein